MLRYSHNLISANSLTCIILEKLLLRTDFIKMHSLQTLEPLPIVVLSAWNKSEPFPCIQGKLYLQGFTWSSFGIIPANAELSGEG